MNFDVIIQCRFYSTRLPGKILIPLNKKLTSLDILIKNLKLIKQINRVILAVPKMMHIRFSIKFLKNIISNVMHQNVSLKMFKKIFLNFGKI